MVKCLKCGKQVNKKSPGLQCCKCNKWLHSTCASITSEQLAALNTTDSIDWKCKACSGGIRPKRISCIMPDPDEDMEDNTDTETASMMTDSMTQKILCDIRKQVNEVIRQELHSSLKFFSDKIDEYSEKITLYEKNMKLLENQCIELKNNIRNINLKTEALELKYNQLEQSQINNHIEICGIKEMEHENTLELTKKVAMILNQKPEDIVKAYRKKQYRTSTAKPSAYSSPVTAILKEGTKNNWLLAARNGAITARNLGVEGESSKIYLREALTSTTAHLLWRTKEELRGIYTYIWCKNGQVLVRKQERDKIITIRTLNQLEKLKIDQVPKIGH